MAEQFIGLEVIVTLRSPANAQLRGLVAGVFGQQLTLHHVVFLQTGTRFPEYKVEGASIADLEVAPQVNDFTRIAPPAAVPTPSAAPHQNVHQLPHINNAPPVPTPNGRKWEDPAILSMGKKPTRTDIPQTPAMPIQVAAPILPQELVAEAAMSTVSHAQPMPPSRLPESTGLNSNSHRPARATLTAPFSSLELTAETGERNGRPWAVMQLETAGPQSLQEPILSEVPIKHEGYSGKRNKRDGNVTRTREDRPKTPSLVVEEEPEVSPLRPKTHVRHHAQHHRVVSEDIESPEKKMPGIRTSRQANPSGKRRNRRERMGQTEYNDGWATEEATDIQGMGEFDFAGNLSKFDKRTVFDQIKAEDNTADEARLVSHNRIQPRAGTAGGKNLHYTENVLDPPNGQDQWNSEAGDSDEDVEKNGDFGSIRGSRKSLSRSSTRLLPTRKGSGRSGAPNPALHATSSLNRAQNSSSHTASPAGKTFLTNGSPALGAISSSKACLRISSSNRVCPVVNPLQMLDVERIAEVEMGLTEDMMTENAGRGVAEVAWSALNGKDREAAHGKHSALPVIVILAGNNKSGARAVAGGRHLRNHGVRVLICVLGLEREEELLEVLRRQLKIFRNSGGRLTRWDGLAADLKLLDSPPELIIDALLGMHISFEDLRTDDQASAYELIGWANKSDASILAIDIPSGIDASTGEVSMLDGESLQVQAKYVVAMGAPKTGILNALASGGVQSWQLSVADIGISNTAWRKYGTRRRHGVEFAQEWVVKLQYRPAVD